MANAMKMRTHACRRRLRIQLVIVSTILTSLVMSVQITSTMTGLLLHASLFQNVTHGRSQMMEYVTLMPPIPVRSAMMPSTGTGHIKFANGLVFASTTRLNFQLESVSTIQATQVKSVTTITPTMTGLLLHAQIIHLAIHGSIWRTQLMCVLMTLPTLVKSVLLKLPITTTGNGAYAQKLITNAYHRSTETHLDIVSTIPTTKVMSVTQ